MQPEQPDRAEAPAQPEPQSAAEQNPPTQSFSALRRDVLKGAAALARGTVAALTLGKGPAAEHPLDLPTDSPTDLASVGNVESALDRAAPDVPASDESKKLDPYRENPDGEYLTTDQGLRVSHTDDSLKAGQRGPTLLEDFHFREKITHFDHERIPERVVHARGAADQCQRPGLLDEGGVQVAQDDLTLELRPEAEVELLNGGRIRKAGLAQSLLGGGVAARHAFLLERYAETAGLAHPISPHRLRHFLLTWLKKQGIDDALIQPYSGHASRQSLEIYSRLAIGEAQVAYDGAMRHFPV